MLGVCAAGLDLSGFFEFGGLRFRSEDVAEYPG